jgi:hypothetical protein
MDRMSEASKKLPKQGGIYIGGVWRTGTKSYWLTNPATGESLVWQPMPTPKR